MSVGAGTAMVARRALPIIALMLVSTACQMPYIPYVNSPSPAAIARLVDASGRVVGEAVLVQQRKGARLVDADGSALVMHERPDDMRTDPAGDSGAPIACGVIILGSPDKPLWRTPWKWKDTRS